MYLRKKIDYRGGRFLQYFFICELIINENLLMYNIILDYKIIIIVIGNKEHSTCTLQGPCHVSQTLLKEPNK